VLIVGAGLIGLKCAEGIRDRVASITFVDLAPRVLPSILDDDAASLVRERLEAAGLSFHLGDSVAKFTKNTATLKESGETLTFDILVLAVGVRPNTALVKDAGGACGRAVTVNGFSATSLPDVYAAGDCTESVDSSTGDTKVMAILPNAYLQGETAGFNMAGIKYSYDSLIPYNAIGFFGIHIVSAGSYTGETYFTREDNNFKRLYYSGNKLCGFILIGDKPGYGDPAVTPAYEKAGIYTSLIREGTPLDTINFDLICRSPGMMAFSKDVRKQKLGGEV
jgi:NADPH-dependent 2,4-dienoyl-CoA reductase/sulfur reductase-like enzyme